MEFNDKLKAIKQTTEQAYVRALTKCNYRRLNEQETKLNKSRESPAPTNRQGFYKTYNEKKQTAPGGRGVNHINSLDKLQKQLNEMRQMYEMQKCANNKDIEQYDCLFFKYITAKTALIKKEKGVINSKKLKMRNKQKNKAKKRKTTNRQANEKHKKCQIKI